MKHPTKKEREAKRREYAEIYNEAFNHGYEVGKRVAQINQNKNLEGIINAYKQTDY